MAERLTSDQVKGLFEKLSNWGKWGKDDQRGALNYITDQQARRGSRPGEDRRDRFACPCRWPPRWRTTTRRRSRT